MELINASVTDTIVIIQFLFEILVNISVAAFGHYQAFLAARSSASCMSSSSCEDLVDSDAENSIYGAQVGVDSMFSTHCVRLPRHLIQDSEGTMRHTILWYPSWAMAISASYVNINRNWESVVGRCFGHVAGVVGDFMSLLYGDVLVGPSS